jgi:hypothetical protein
MLAWVSLGAYILVRFIPFWTLYVVVPISVFFIALGIGHFAIKKGIYQHQNAIASENNPYLSAILGSKDYVGWRGALRGVELTAETVRLDIQWFKSMGYDTKQLEERLARYLKLKEYYINLLKNAKVPPEVPEELRD